MSLEDGGKQERPQKIDALQWSDVPELQIEPHRPEVEPVPDAPEIRRKPLSKIYEEEHEEREHRKKIRDDKNRPTLH